MCRRFCLMLSGNNLSVQHKHFEIVPFPHELADFLLLMRGHGQASALVIKEHPKFSINDGTSNSMNPILPEHQPVEVIQLLISENVHFSSSFRIIIYQHSWHVFILTYFSHSFNCYVLFSTLLIAFRIILFFLFSLKIIAHKYKIAINIPIFFPINK